MKPLSALNSLAVTNIKLVSLDVDGVIVEKGTEIIEKDRILTIKTKNISQNLLKKIIELKKFVHVNISSGRSLLYLKDMFDPLLWENASLQSENGVFTLLAGRVIQHEDMKFEELALLSNIKNEIIELGKNNKNIRGFEPKQFLISVHCFNEELEIVNLVKKLDTKNMLYIKWSSEAYNIFPKRISKASGIKALIKILGLETSQVLVVGNDPNDKEAAEELGISVTTSPDTLTADFQTENKSALGGDELVDHLLSVLGK